MRFADGGHSRTVSWQNGKIRLIDQTRLPHEEVWLEISDHGVLAEAIREMRVRGAPAIGAAAAYGLALAAQAFVDRAPSEFQTAFEESVRLLAATRPTAVNLFWAINRIVAAATQSGTEPGDIARAVLDEAHRIADEDVAACEAMGRYGAELLPESATVLTHCNAGALATVDYGTALGVIRAGHTAGKVKRVLVDETRPLLQGARLTAWELAQEGIPLTLITDSMAGHFMRRGEVSCVVVGSDRIAANGDVANKIGTYSVAVLAHENGIPFYVAAPTSTIDLNVPNGDAIPIEERRPIEVTELGGRRVAAHGIEVANPAFDVTPARYVTAIITETGVIRAPFADGLRESVAAAARLRGR